MDKKHITWSLLSLEQVRIPCNAGFRLRAVGSGVAAASRFRGPLRLCLGVVEGLENIQEE